MTVAIVIILVIIAAIYIFMKGAQFGRLPTGTALEKIRASPNFRDGQFQNIHFTPDLKEGVSYFTVMQKFFFGKSKRSKPSVVLPSIKTNLHTLSPTENVLVWFGHSSYFMQVDGKKISVDPVFSGSASPVKFTTRSFKGSDVYTTTDMPEIDFLFISHDHWDHLDYETMVKLKPKIKKVITGLGVAVHLERWGFSKEMIVENDWNDKINLGDGFSVNVTSGRHFSGRTFKRNRSIWLSYVFTTPTMKLFLGGDSGYDTHFKTIGDQFGPFDLVILECGQYNEYWRYIHMMPEETVQAAIDLKSARLLPVHWSKFSLALHDWDEPIKRVVKQSSDKNVSIITPQIGEAVNLKSHFISKEWWKALD